MREAMFAIIKKDFRGIAGNRRLFATLMITPLILTTILPSIFLCTIHFAPNDPDIQNFLKLLPQQSQSGSLEQTLAEMLLNFVLPLFFLMIPIMAASIMAASSFIGEKEKHTLETLLYCPLSVKEIFRAKVLASFALSMMVSLVSFLTMMLVLEIEAFFLLGDVLLPGANWLVVLLLFAPAISLIAVTLIVRSSAKAQSMEESQQSAVFLVLPLILLVTGQFMGVLLISFWILLGLSILCWIVAGLLLKKCMGKFHYEVLLKM